MNPELAVLTVAALLTAGLSAVLGMAGGIVLLAVMLFFFEPLVAIPLHAVVQLASNGSRSLMQWRNVERSIVLPYALLLLPGAYAGVQLAQALPTNVMRIGIGVFILVATWRKVWLGRAVIGERFPRFLVVGGAAGFFGPLVGATGPLIAPFFLDQGLSRQQIVGTKAACQVLGHVSKVALFGFVGFAFHEQLDVLVAMTLAVVLGTWMGTQVLEKVSEPLFLTLYRAALTLAALRLILAG